MTTPEEAKRKTLVYLNRKPKVKIEDNGSSEFVGTPVQISTVYDYATIDGKSYPILSCFGEFREPLVDEMGGNNTNSVVDRWKIRPTVKFTPNRTG